MSDEVVDCFVHNQEALSTSDRNEIYLSNGLCNWLTVGEVD